MELSSHGASFPTQKRLYGIFVRERKKKKNSKIFAEVESSSSISRHELEMMSSRALVFDLVGGSE